MPRISRTRYEWSGDVCKITTYRQVDGGRRAVFGQILVDRKDLRTALLVPENITKLGLKAPARPSTT